MNTGSNIKPTTNANYKNAPNFHIRETQGQEPWCASYVEAGAINTIGKAPLNNTANKGAITTAKKLMQFTYPGVPDKELVKKSGGTIADSLKMDEKNYKTTATVEERVLSFAEIKKEIDAGGIISVDGYNSDSKDKPGTGENLGHEVAIVGYVTPTSGKQTPYYIVWNPWWNMTFYLSANAKTFNLGGVKYKWTRTWHNWRKTSPKSRSLQSIDPEIGKQKVASTANPMALKESTNLSLDLANSGTFSNNLQKFNHTQNILSQNVAQFGAEISVYAPFYGDTFGYSESLDNKKSFMRVRYNRNTKTVSYGNGAAFSKKVDSLIDIGDELTLTSGLTIAYYTALITVAITFPEATVIVSAMESLGIVVKGMSPIELVRLLLKYINTVNSTKSDYNGLHT